MVSYSQTTGVLTLPSGTMQCYSGHGPGLNNPAMQNVQGVGPIPQGVWRMRWATDDDTGPKSIILDPEPGTETFGRVGLRIHGDNSEHNKTGSHGCIVHSPASDRDLIFSAGPLITVTS